MVKCLCLLLFLLFVREAVLYSVHKLMYSRPVLSLCFFSPLGTYVILNGAQLCHPDVQRLCQSFRSSTRAVNGRGCCQFHRLPLEGGGGWELQRSRSQTLGFGGRDAGWARGVTISEWDSWVQNCDRLRCPSGLSNFVGSHLFLLMCWKAGGAVDPGCGSGCTNIF